MTYNAIKNYINEFLFQNIGKVTKKYIELMKEFNPCSVQEEETENREFVLYYEEQLLNFFNNVLENCVLDDVELVLAEWDKDKMLSCRNYKMPEDLIARYTILKETLRYFISFYTRDFKVINTLVTELDDLDESIQKLIIRKFQEQENN